MDAYSFTVVSLLFGILFQSIFELVQVFTAGVLLALAILMD